MSRDQEMKKGPMRTGEKKRLYENETGSVIEHMCYECVRGKAEVKRYKWGQVRDMERGGDEKRIKK